MVWSYLADQKSVSSLSRAQQGRKGGNNSPGAESLGSTEKVQQCRMNILQYSAFTPKRPYARTWGRQTSVLPGRHLTSVRPWPLCLRRRRTWTTLFYCNVHRIARAAIFNSIPHVFAKCDLGKHFELLRQVHFLRFCLICQNCRFSFFCYFCRCGPVFGMLWPILIVLVRNLVVTQHTCTNQANACCNNCFKINKLRMWALEILKTKRFKRQNIYYNEHHQ